MHYEHILFQPNKKKMLSRLDGLNLDKIRDAKIKIDKKISELQNKLTLQHLKFEAKYNVQINYDKRSVEESDFILDQLSEEQIANLSIIKRKFDQYTLGTRIKLNICNQSLEIIDKYLGIKYTNNKSAISVKTTVKPSKYYGYGSSNDRFQVNKKN